MAVTTLDFAQPFFRVRHIENEQVVDITGKTIVLNLSDESLQIDVQSLYSLQSCIAVNTPLHDVKRAVLVDDISRHNNEVELFDAVKKQWPSAFDVRGEERLRGVQHYMSPKVFVDNVGLTMYHSGSVPLNVGLHKEHPFCPVPGFREVHTQIVGFGKMQQCYERDISTLYLEEPMAPGATHRPMYDEQGNYPWHQYETITPAIFMAVEMLPVGVNVDELI